MAVCGGLSVSGCITEDGGLYMWGSGGEGLLGNGSMDRDESLPLRVGSSGAFQGGVIGLSIGGQHLAMIVKGGGGGHKRQR